MTNLSIQVDGYVSPFASQLPKVAVSDIIYIEKFEEDAYGHWLFGADSGSLIDKVNSRALSLQSGATVQPMYGNGFVELGASKGNSLQSNLLDNVGNGFTVSGVVLPGTIDLMVLLGNLGDNTAPQGAGIFASANKVYLTSRTTVSSLEAGLLIDMSKPFFISFSVNKTTTVVNIVAMQNGVTYEKTSSGAYTGAASALSVGNSRYTTSAAYNSLKNKYYEAIIHDKALSLAEMKGIASRAKTRQAYRGISF
ncbi:hypothetical protein [Acinetobacter johnsonii]|uniref:hypothetical protein n=1 Tax=Acinetobacter johnsonii TaxID=40214 RepID=UPI00301B41E1